MKFKDLRTGIILEPHSEMVIEQMRNSGEYAPVEETKEEVKQETKEVKAPKKKKK